MKVFITRNIKENSPLRSINVDMEGHSLLTFNQIEFDTFPETDWIFFYSANGVRFFAKQVKYLGYKINAKIGVMGPGTASAYEALFGVLPDFVGDGLKDVAIEFFNSNNESILFVKGSNSLESVERFIDSSRFEELIVYSNEINKNATIPEADIYILTSPLNAQAYMDVSCCRFNTRIIAIGPSTNSRLMEKGFLLASVPDTPSEESIATLLKTMCHV